MIEAEIFPMIGEAARNERRKAAATTCNALAVALFVSAFLQPLMLGRPNVGVMIGALVGFVVFQTILHYI